MINEPPLQSPIEQGGRFTQGWANFFAATYRICSALSSSGTTADRPTKTLWIGRMYYDTTLNKPVWVQQVTPSVVWKDAAGNTV